VVKTTRSRENNLFPKGCTSDKYLFLPFQYEQEMSTDSEFHYILNFPLSESLPVPNNYCFETTGIEKPLTIRSGALPQSYLGATTMIESPKVVVYLKISNI
jgi:hypothetical protein